MFDENLTPVNLPTGKEPEDIFEKVAPAPLPKGATTPIAPTPDTSDIERMAEAEAGAEVKSPLVSSRKVVLVLGVLLGILVIVGIVLGILRFVRRTAAPASPAPSAAAPDLTPPPAEFVPSEPSVSTGLEEASAPAEAPTDTDGDGLTDAEEQELQTDPSRADSDTDGLFDREEVKTYETNPLNPDTDGDTFLDGTEVRNGYNPKGEGRLFTVPSQ